MSATAQTKPINQVTTKCLCLQNIADGNYQFIIPSYQRPYVWHDDTVLKLFDDIVQSYQDNEDYFIGTVLTAKRQLENKEMAYELIDGQQRTTTLMLIAFAFKALEIDHKIADVAVYKDSPRLSFAIRHEVQQLFGHYAGLKKYDQPSSDSIDRNPYLKRLSAALKVLKQAIENSKEKKIESKALADHIYHRVHWVNNTVPNTIDLNRLFSTMNTTGVQLEPADILKAKLLAKINAQKPLYDAIWAACEHMDNYFERNVRKVFSTADWNTIEEAQLHKFDPQLFVKSDAEEATLGDGKTLWELANEGVAAGATPKSTAQSETAELDNDETIYCESIISFPLLLIHSLRIYQLEQEEAVTSKRLHADRLLAIFDDFLKDANEAAVKDFLNTLWQVRYQFDRWVIKWVEQGDSDEAVLLLTSTSRSNYYISRSPKAMGPVAVLQSVRNFTGERTAQYWLTPFVKFLIDNPQASEETVLSKLEKIDNALSLAGEGETQKSASYKLAKSEVPEQVKLSEITSYLEQAKGTGFEHYWFQKLEYILWKQFNSKSNKPDRFDTYRITSKNSVEHVFPQNEEYKQALDDKYLHSFGNLALLSPGENSSYSNQAVAKKYEDFKAKPKLESLKLQVMFDDFESGGRAWGKSQIEAHTSDVITLIKQHYGLPLIASD